MLRKAFISIPIMLLLVSCDWTKGYEEERQEKLPEAQAVCQEHNQKLLSLSYENGWIARCYQESPFKIIIQEME